MSNMNLKITRLCLESCCILVDGIPACNKHCMPVFLALWLLFLLEFKPAFPNILLAMLPMVFLSIGAFLYQISQFGFLSVVDKNEKMFATTEAVVVFHILYNEIQGSDHLLQSHDINNVDIVYLITQKWHNFTFYMRLNNY